MAQFNIGDPPNNIPQAIQWLIAIVQQQQRRISALQASGGGGGSVAIGSPVGGGTPTCILFIDGTGNLAQDIDGLAWDNTIQEGYMGSQTGIAFILVSNSSFGVQLGDVNSNGNGTRLLVRDGTRRIDFIAPNVFFDDLNGTGVKPALLSASGQLQRSLYNVPLILAVSGVPSAVNTGTTAEVNLVSVPLPANTLSSTGCLRIGVLYSCTGTAGNKTPFIRIDTVANSTGGQAIFNNVQNSTALSIRMIELNVYAANSTSAQTVFPLIAIGGAVSPVLTPTIDMTVNQFINFNSQLVNGGDSMQIMGYTVEVLNP